MSHHKVFSTDNYIPTTADWIGFVGMVVGMFMAILDIQIVASSINEIQAGLSATPDEATWIQTSYLIAEVIMIPLSGWLARAFSTRYLFLLSCGGFTIMSIACAFAWNLDSMILFRALQGFFGGAMIPTVFSVIYGFFPRRLKPALSAIVGLVVTLAPSTGPVIGGWITDNISWHALFTINIIPGILVCFTTLFYAKFDEPDWSLIKKIDIWGIIYVGVFLGCLQYVLEEGTRNDWFNSRKIIMFSSVSALGAFLFLVHELSCKHPIIDLFAFKDRNFAAGCLFSFILGWGLYNVVFLTPVYLSQVKGLNSQQIGFYVAVMGMFQFLMAPVSAGLSKKADLRKMSAFGMAVFGIGCIMNSRLSYDSGYWEFFFPQMVRGVGVMFAIIPVNLIAMGTLPPQEVKNASGLYNLTRNLGGAIGLAVTGTFLQDWPKSHYAVLREHITDTSVKALSLIENFSDYLSSLNVVKPDDAIIKILYGIAQREASIMTFNDIFYVMGLMFILSLIALPLITVINPTKEAAEVH
ncbi:MAG: DHA2 family efflux MFS transporter permease subunit [Alphaproteobacteria bacterium]